MACTDLWWDTRNEGNELLGLPMGFWADLVTMLRHGPRVLLAQADEIPGDPVRQWRVGLVGEGKTNRDGSRRQDVIRRCSEGERVLLVRKPDNTHDENAILVCRLDGQGLGYIPADQAIDLADDLDNGAKFNAYTECSRSLPGAMNISLLTIPNDLFIVPPMDNELFPILAKLGGRDAAFSQMQLAGWRHGPSALRMMINRRRLSAEAMRVLMMAAETAGIPYCAKDFQPSGVPDGEAA